jgi:hypothetical protein
VAFCRRLVTGSADSIFDCAPGRQSPCACCLESMQEKARNGQVNTLVPHGDFTQSRDTFVSSSRPRSALLKSSSLLCQT